MDGIQIWQSSKRIKMTCVQKFESWAKFRLHNCGKTGKKIPCNEITFVGSGGISDRRFHIIQLNGGSKVGRLCIKVCNSHFQSLKRA
jgi:hypothetical protein